VIARLRMLAGNRQRGLRRCDRFGADGDLVTLDVLELSTVAAPAIRDTLVHMAKFGVPAVLLIYQSLPGCSR